jgi:hypothetical protein
VIISIEILRYNYPIKHKTEKIECKSHPLYSDQPTTDDKYDRITSAEVLI